MILEKESGEGGFISDELMPIEVKMIQSTVIPQCIPLDFYELDLKITLRYNISGKRMLSQCLRGEKLTLGTLYAILLQLVTILDHSRRYMLRPDHYVLHPDYMFIEGTLEMGALWVCYVPVVEALQPEPLHQRVRGILTMLMGSVAELSGNGIQQLIQYCQESQFSLEGFKTLLLQLLTNQSGMPENPSVISATPLEKAFIPSPGLDRIQKHHEPPIDAAMTPSFSGRLDGNIISPEIMQPDSRLEQGEVFSLRKYMTYILLGGVLLLALIWKFVYVSYGAVDGTFFVCMGLSLLVGDVIFLAWRGYSPPWLKGKQELALDGGAGTWEGPSQDMDRNFRESKHKWQEPDNEASGLLFQVPSFTADKLTSGSRQPPQEKQASNPYGVMAPIVAPIVQEPTVWLHEGQTETLNRELKKKPIIERLIPGRRDPEQIQIQQASFIIGRSGDVAHYLDTSPGVSRTHVEIIESQEGYHIKDLGSKNGTKLRKEPMVPYTAYPLADGDRFVVAQSEYVFKWVNNG
jgi:hypothetical protein